eukprot:2593550-Prymnesium_polylepis.1
MRVDVLGTSKKVTIRVRGSVCCNPVRKVERMLRTALVLQWCRVISHPTEPTTAARRRATGHDEPIHKRFR